MAEKEKPKDPPERKEEKDELPEEGKRLGYRLEGKTTWPM